MGGSKARQTVVSGQVFGKWTVTTGEVVKKNNRRAVEVVCECGNKSVTVISSLYSGLSRQCLSCAQQERRSSECEGFSDLWKANRVARNYIKNAVVRGIEWHLTDEQVARIIFENCTYCEVPPSNTLRQYGGRNFQYSGIDRIIPSQPYKTGNVAPCCFKCNYAKMQMTAGEFCEWLERFGTDTTALRARIDKIKEDDNAQAQTVPVRGMAS